MVLMYITLPLKIELKKKIIRPLINFFLFDIHVFELNRFFFFKMSRFQTVFTVKFT